MIQIVTELQKFWWFGGQPSWYLPPWWVGGTSASPKERGAKEGNRGSASREIRVLDSEVWAGR